MLGKLQHLVLTTNHSQLSLCHPIITQCSNFCSNCHGLDGGIYIWPIHHSISGMGFFRNAEFSDNVQYSIVLPVRQCLILWLASNLNLLTPEGCLIWIIHYFLWVAAVSVVLFSEANSCIVGVFLALLLFLAKEQIRIQRSLKKKHKFYYSWFLVVNPIHMNFACPKLVYFYFKWTF